MIIEQGDESWEIEPLSRDDTLVEGFYGAESTTDGFELTKVGYDGDGEDVNIIGNSPLEDTPDTFTLTTLELREDTGEDQLPVLLNTVYDTRPIRASTPTGVEEDEDTSKLFLYEDSEGVSLVVIHDSPETDSGGEATFKFDQLPEGDWVVEDGPGDIRRTETDNVVNWRWNTEETDGGAYRFNAEEFSFNLTPSFESGIDSWEFLADDAKEPRRIQLDLNEPVTVRVRGTDRISASATTIAYVPGLDEDPETGGDITNSAFPDEERPFPASGFLPSPIDLLRIGDTSFYGDEIRRLPDKVSSVMELEKEPPGISSDENLRKFRFKNTINIEFNLEDDQIDKESIKIRVNAALPLSNDVESQLPDYIKPIEYLKTGSERPSKTVVHDEETLVKINQIIQGAGGSRFDDRTSVAVSKPRYIYATQSEFNYFGQTIQGVLASTIWGSSNPYTARLINSLGGEGGELDLPGGTPQDNPVIYSWIEMACLANGAKLVRVADTSVFPKHVAYLDGLRVDDSGLTVYFDNRSETSDTSFDVGINEDTNNVWDSFKIEAEQGIVSPYRSPHNSYIEKYDGVNAELSEVYSHPNMLFGKDENGSPLTNQQVIDILESGQQGDGPLDPFPGAGNRV